LPPKTKAPIVLHHTALVYRNQLITV